MAAPGAATIPASFVCPITQEPMEDPVTTADGHVYERKAIEAWFVTCGATRRSPLTNQPLENSSLVPNPPLRRAIEEYFSSEPMLNPAASDSTQVMLEGLEEKASCAMHLRDSLEAFRTETRAIRSEMGGLLSLLQDSFQRLDALEHSVSVVLNRLSAAEDSSSTCSSPSRSQRKRQHASVAWGSTPTSASSAATEGAASPSVAQGNVLAAPAEIQVPATTPPSPPPEVRDPLRSVGRAGLATNRGSSQDPPARSPSASRPALFAGDVLLPRPSAEQAFQAPQQPSPGARRSLFDDGGSDRPGDRPTPRARHSLFDDGGSQQNRNRPAPRARRSLFDDDDESEQPGNRPHPRARRSLFDE